MSAPFQHELTIALDAVRSAAQLCQTVQQSLAVEGLKKRDRSPVTVADFGSQAVVCRALRAAFPDDPIIAEEDSAALASPENAEVLRQVVSHVQALHPGADTPSVRSWIDYGGAHAYSDRFWTLDPIDGTKGFLRGEQYAIALALIVEGELTLAALACPNLPTEPGSESRGVVYTAIQGQGTFAHALTPTGDSSPVLVSETTPTAQARFCESVESGHTSHSDAADVADHLNITAEPVRLDSQAKYAVVARGEADIYMRLPTRPGYVEKIWDHAAGALVVSEAGGTATDIYGQPLDFTHGYQLEANKGVIVTNGRIHAQVLEALQSVGVGA